MPLPYKLILSLSDGLHETIDNHTRLADQIRAWMKAFLRGNYKINGMIVEFATLEDMRHFQLKWEVPSARQNPVPYFKPKK